MAKPWFPMFWRDYLADTTMLTLTEHGAYLKLLGALYIEERPLPAEWPRLYAICGAKDEIDQAAIRTVVDRYFEKDVEGLVQRRAMAEIAKRQHISDRNTRISRNRYQTSTRNAPDDAPDSHQNSTSTYTTTGRTKDQDKNGRVATLPEWLDLQAWGEWEAYRREAKKKLTPSTVKKQLKFLEQHKPDHIAIINQSIEKGWQGLFELKGASHGSQTFVGNSARDRVARATADHARDAGPEGGGGTMEKDGRHVRTQVGKPVR